MLRRRGLNSAAMARVEATIASWDSCPVRARNTPCNTTTLPTYTSASVTVRAVDQRAVDDEVYVVEAVFEDRNPRGSWDGAKAQQEKRRPNPLSLRGRR